LKGPLSAPKHGKEDPNNEVCVIEYCGDVIIIHLYRRQHQSRMLEETLGQVVLAVETLLD
jgi:hypothetical protein